jgi:hypothetical protein
MHYKEAYPVLQKMMEDFDSWFPFDGTEDEEEREMYREGFARCKLNLELGEYTRDDLDYLQRIYDTVEDDEEYRGAIMAFIVALSDEYGWI